MNCPACSSRKHKALGNQLFTCLSCNALHGSCYLGDSYGYVLPYMSKRTDMEGARYFDLECVGSKGLVRRHGWYDPETKLILQVG
jgi:hypothetical protein